MTRSSVWINLLLVLFLSACAGTPGKVSTSAVTQTPLTETKVAFSGRVIDIDGNPIPGADVRSAIGVTVSDAQGWFKLAGQSSPQWLTVRHSGFISRTRAAAPGTPVLFRLTPDDGHTILVQFGGDTMFGRRFFDPNEDGNTADGLLPVNPTVADHLKLLAPVQPLLENADLTVVNFESPLAKPAFVSPRDPRPVAYHSTKDYIFASDPNAVIALQQAGVDMVDIGNNHLYDILESGLKDTVSQLDQANLPHFGGGTYEAAAWEPAIADVKGQKIAFIGCTTISRPLPEKTDQDVTYVASDALHKGGAALCQAAKLRDAVAHAKQKADSVVVMIHGGVEYSRTPTENVSNYSKIAKDAGATLVINHHPHVVSGFSVDNQSLTAWSLGNFIFDQTVWPTFETYLLSVYLRDGKLIRATVEPLMMENYVAHGLTGPSADYVVRGAAGRMPGPFVMESSAMEIDLSQRAIEKTSSQLFDGGPTPGTIIAPPPAQWISDFKGSGSIRFGRDLLWVGAFEKDTVGSSSQGAPLWELTDAEIDPAYAYAGQAGIRLTRGNKNIQDAVTTPLHRILVDKGANLSIIGMVRASAGASPVVQLSWYADTMGPSASLTTKPVAVNSPDVWQSFRLDVQAPDNAVAMGPFLRLPPPASGTARVDFDNIRVIQWAGPDVSFSPLYNFAQITGPGTVTFSQQVLPGGESWLTQASDQKK